MAAIYDGATTQINESTCAEFIIADVSGDLIDVPGVGKTAVKAISDAGASNTFALLGKFLMLRKEGMTGQAHQNAMAQYLKDIKVNSHRSDVVYSCSEKLRSLFPKLCPDEEAEIDAEIDAEIARVEAEPDWSSDDGNGDAGNAAFDAGQAYARQASPVNAASPAASPARASPVRQRPAPEKGEAVKLQK